MMNKIVTSIIVMLICGGCHSYSSGVLTDGGKPVAPTSYQEGTSDATDPQLPPMTPHWKERK